MCVVFIWPRVGRPTLMRCHHHLVFPGWIGRLGCFVVQVVLGCSCRERSCKLFALLTVFQKWIQEVSVCFELFSSPELCSLCSK